MSVILVRLTTCRRNSEPAEQWAAGTTGRRNSGAALRTGGGTGGVSGKMGGVADTQVCFGVKLIRKCDH